MRTLASATLTLVLALTLVACGKVESELPDADEPPPTDAQVDSPDAPDVTTCTPDEFVDCDGGNARICNANGNGVIIMSCGTAGCNADARRCNQCVPSSVVCDGNVVESCDADGLELPDEPCLRSCVATPSAHCEYLAPVYLPDVCDARATMPSLAISTSVTIDTGLDTNCTGGIVTQTGGPPICVIRYGTIDVQSGRTLTLTGGRAAAFVADGDLTVAGTIDAAASGLTHGPGGGTLTSGGLANASAGGGGAGYLTAGAAGANLTTNGGANNGGAAFDPLGGSVLVGGARGARPSIALGVSGGGGGGALMLVSCRGNVIVSGLLDLGGGGGNGGIDLSAGAQLMLIGGGGGGTGGYGVLQGLGVQVTGQVFANGGGGGGGGANDAAGSAGGDGTRSTTTAATGGAGATVGTSVGGRGGTGGRVGANPGVGLIPTSQGSPGGGGGSVGRFQAYTPTGVTPTLTPSAASPPFQSNRTVPTR